MDQKARTELELALKHARQTVATLELLLSKRVDVPPEIAALVAKRVADRVCLSCLLPIASGENAKRGNHITCYSTQRARIRAGSETEENLVLIGKFTAEAKKPGRKAALDLAEDTIAKSIANKIDRKTKKASERKEKHDNS